MKSFYKLILLCIVTCFSSCIEDLDFDQAQGIELEPAIALSLLNFEFSQEDLIAFDILTNPTITDETLLPSFENALIQEDLDRIVLQIEAANTFNDNFVIQLTFYDENDVATYVSSSIVLPANEENFSYEEEIVILNNPGFLNSHKVSATLVYEGTSINSAEEVSLNFKSAGIFYFSID